MAWSYVYYMKHRKLTPHEIRVVAAAAGVQDKTVQRYLATGKNKSVATTDAIKRELARLFPDVEHFAVQSKAS
jgi:hypothetical protein